MLIKQTTQMTDSERIATENSNNQFLQSLSFVAVGTIYPFAGSTIPDTFMLCDGSALDTTEYSELFSVIGYTYGGSGDSFNIPDLRGKVLVGCDSSDTSFNALGKKGGAKEVTLTVAQMPEHEGHLYGNVAPFPPNGPDSYFIVSGPGIDSGLLAKYEDRPYIVTASNEVIIKGFSRGGDQPHENMPPYMVCNYIIKVNQGISTDDFRLPIDQTYTPTSPNAQSGIATAEAVGVANDYTDKAIKSSKNYANNTFAPAIKNTVSGSVLAVHDVSPAEHALNIKLSSDTLTDFSNVGVSRLGKNLFDMDGSFNKVLTGLYPEGMAYDCEVEKISSDEWRFYNLTKSNSIAYMYIPLELKRNTNYTISITVNVSDNIANNTSIIGIGFLDTVDVWEITKIIDGLINFSNTDVQYVKTFNSKNYTELWLKGYITYSAVDGDIFIIKNIQLEEGTTATDYEPYIEPQTVTANADGTVEGLTSLSPDMTVMTNTEGVVIDMTYNADTKMYIDNKLAKIKAELSAAIVNS